MSEEESDATRNRRGQDEKESRASELMIYMKLPKATGVCREKKQNTRVYMELIVVKAWHG